MTIVKYALKSALILILAAAALTCISSCEADRENDILSTLESQKNADFGEDIDYYRVIIPSSASAELVSTAKTLSLKIAEQTGVDCGVIYDNEYTQGKEQWFDIFVGNTNASETQTALDGLLRDDYVCKTADRYLILGAISDSAAINAVERFIDEVLPLCEGSRITDYESDFEHHMDYEVDTLTVCGFDIGDYDFVCTFSRESEQASAVYKLRELIADRCGAYPDVRFGESQKDGVKEIVFSIDENKNGFAQIERNEEDVEVSAAGSYGLSVGLERLYSRLFENLSDGRANLDITYSMSYPYQLPKIELAAVLTDIPSSASIVADALKLAKSIPTSADAVVLGKLNKDVSDLVKNNLENGFVMKALALDNDTVVAFAYKETVFDVGNVTLGNIGSVSLLSVELNSSSGGQDLLLFTYIEQSRDDRNGAVQSLKNKIKDSKDLAMAVYICADNTLLDVTGEGITTCYNDSLTLGADVSRVGVFVSDNGFGCIASGINQVDVGKSLTIHAQKLFCDDFCALC